MRILLRHSVIPQYSRLCLVTWQQNRSRSSIFANQFCHSTNHHHCSIGSSCLIDASKWNKFSPDNVQSEVYTWADIKSGCGWTNLSLYLADRSITRRLTNSQVVNKSMHWHLSRFRWLVHIYFIYWPALLWQSINSVHLLLHSNIKAHKSTSEMIRMTQMS